jgi:hypothetical protein
MLIFCFLPLTLQLPDFARAPFELTAMGWKSSQYLCNDGDRLHTFWSFFRFRNPFLRLLERRTGFIIPWGYEVEVYKKRILIIGPNFIGREYIPGS